METCKNIGTCKKIHNGQHNYYSASRENKWTKKNIRIDILYLGKYLSISKYLSVLLQHWQVFVSAISITSLAGICPNCYLTCNYLSILLPHWHLYVSSVTDTTLASICLN